MSDRSKIEWTDATWNPIRGCTRVSEGCTNCYAETVAARFSGPGQPYEGLAKMVTRPGGQREARWTGAVHLIEKHLDDPLRWKKPRMVFVNSMSDLFHEKVPDAWIDRIFAVMALAPQHTFQILTKRPKRMREYLTKTVQGPWAGRAFTIDDDGKQRPTEDVVMRLRGGVLTDTLSRAPADALNRAAEWQDQHYPGGDGFMRRWPLPNVWMGVSVEDQATADERIPLLLDTPAAIRWISAEPLLGPIDLTHLQPPDMPIEVDALSGRNGVIRPLRGISPALDWVVAGGESGPNARWMNREWAYLMRDDCRTANVPFFMKQLSGPGGRAIKDITRFPEGLQIREYPNAA